MRSGRRAIPLVLLLATEAAAAVALHRLGSRPPFDLPLDRLEPWLRADPVDALAAGARLAALGFVWWLAATTGLYAAARATRFPAALRACRFVTPAGIRLIVDRALVASVVAAALHVPSSPPLSAATPDPPPTSVVVRTGRAPAPPATGAPEAPATTTTTPEPDTATAPAPGAPPPPPSTGAPAAPAAPDGWAEPVAPGPEEATLPDATSTGGSTSVVVRPGDNLWDLAAEALAARAGIPRATLDAAEIARYWRAVCDANRAGLRSGDVNLIYPGERVLLPPAR